MGRIYLFLLSTINWLALVLVMECLFKRRILVIKNILRSVLIALSISMVYSIVSQSTFVLQMNDTAIFLNHLFLFLLEPVVLLLTCLLIFKHRFNKALFRASSLKAL